MRESSQRRYLGVQEEIVSAAYSIVCDKGLAALSMRAISSSNHRSPASLYEYFTNKDEIVCAIFYKTIAALEAHVRQVDICLPPDEYLIALCLRYLDFADKEQRQVAVMQDTAQAIISMRVAAGSSREADRSLISNTKDLFTLFLLGVVLYLHWQKITPSVYLSAEDIAHTLLAMTYGSMIAPYKSEATSPAVLSASVRSLLNGLEITTISGVRVIGRRIGAEDA